MSANQCVRYYPLARNVVTVLATPLLVLRFAQVFHIVTLKGAVNYVTFVASVTTLIGAVALGWLVDARRLANRAMIAEWENALLRRAKRQQRESEDAEWSRWWSEAREDDTIAFGPVVVSLDARRFTQQPMVG